MLNRNQLGGYAFPPLPLIGQCLRLFLQQSVSQLTIVTLVWQTQPWYTLLLELSIDNPMLLPSFSSLRATEMRGQSAPSCPPSTSWMACLRSCYQGSAVSQPAQRLLLAAWRPRTEKTYSSAWRKWIGLCGEQQVNPLSATLETILNFLASQVDNGLQYGTLNVYRSALSATYSQIEGYNVGEYLLVAQLLKGIFNSRQPKPRSAYTWDVSKVTCYLESLGPHEHLIIIKTT